MVITAQNVIMVIAPTTNPKRRKMMETTDYCSYELSKALKVAGFDEPCGKSIKIIHGTEREEWDEEECQWCTIQDIEYYPKITLWQAQKWLREEKKIDVLVYNCACGYLWEVSKATNGTGLILFDKKGDDENSGCWTSYEAALSSGIAASLELIRK